MNRVLEEGRTDYHRLMMMRLRISHAQPITAALAALALTAAMLTAQTFRSNDSVIRRIWVEGMENSSAAAYAPP